MIKLVIIESPYSDDVEANLDYAKSAVLDCIDRGETPYASHLFFPQMLDDNDEAQRTTGINLGLEIGQAFFYAGLETDDKFSAKVVVYVDRGWSRGMEAAIEHYSELGLPVEIRRLYPRAATPQQSTT